MVSNTDSDSLDLPSASQPAVNRVKAYEKIIGLAKDQKNEPTLRNTCKKLSSKTAVILEDVMSENRQLVEAGLQTLGLLLQDDYMVRNSSPIVMSSVLSTLCEVLLKTEDKTVATRALWCLAKQSFPVDVLAAHVHPIVNAAEHALTQVAPSAAVAYEGLDLLSVLVQRLPKQMASAVVRWSPLVFGHLTSTADRVSERALAVFDIGLPAIQAARSDVVDGLLTSIKKHLSAGLIRAVKGQKTAVSALRCWSGIVHLLGSELHRTSVINMLLPCLEAAFRSSSTEVRVAAFSAWRALCDNFAEDRDVLQDSKRMKLVMQIFRARNAKIEAVAQAKFQAWWHYICLLGDSAMDQPHFENVFVPLVSFCFGTDMDSSGMLMPASTNCNAAPTTPRSSRAAPPTSPSPTIAVKPDTPGGSEGQPFASLKEPGVEVIASALGLVVDTALLSDRLKAGIILSNEALIHNIAAITTAVRIGLVDCSNPKTASSRSKLWSRLVERVISALDGCSKQKAGELVSTLFSTLRFILLVGSSADNRCDQQSPEQCLGLVSDFLRLPTSFLVSSSGPTFAAADYDCYLFLLADLLLTHVMPVISSLADAVRFQAVLEHILAIGCGTSIGVLSFCERVVTLLERQASLPVHCPQQHVTCALVWSAVADRVIRHIQHGGNINQGTTVAYNFGCLYQLLLFPVKWFSWPSIPESRCLGLLSRWEILCKGLSKEAALMVCTPNNIWCEELCHSIHQHFESLEGASKDLWLGKLASMVACICDGLETFSPSSSGTGWKSPRSKNKTLSNYGSLVKLLAKLLGCLASGSASISDQCDDPVMAAALESTCSTVVTTAHRLLQRIPQLYIADVIIVLCGGLTPPGTITSSDISTSSKWFPQFERLWQAMSSCLQLRYTGAYDSKLLTAMTPLVIAAVSHEKRRVKNETLSFWQATFGKSKGLGLSAQLRAAIAEATAVPDVRLASISGDIEPSTEAAKYASSSSLSDGESQSQVELPAMPGMVSARQPIGSFLGRNKDSPTKPLMASMSPAKTSPAKAGVCSSTVTVALSRIGVSPSLQESPAAKAQKRGLLGCTPKKDEAFVFIAPSPQKKLILTEHQKERFKEKRILPLMYNGLDASQDTACFVATQDDSMSQCTQYIGTGITEPVRESCKAMIKYGEASDAAEYIDIRHDGGRIEQAVLASCIIPDSRDSQELLQASCTELVSSGLTTANSIVVPQSATPSELTQVLTSFDPRPTSLDQSFIPSSPKAKPPASSPPIVRLPVAKARRISASNSKSGPGLFKWFPSVSSQVDIIGTPSAAMASSTSNDTANEIIMSNSGQLNLSAPLLPDDEQLAHPIDDDAVLKMNSASYIGIHRERRHNSGSTGTKGDQISCSVPSGIEPTGPIGQGTVNVSEEAKETDNLGNTLVDNTCRLQEACGSPSADEIEQIVLEKSFEAGFPSPISQPNDGVSTMCSQSPRQRHLPMADSLPIGEGPNSFQDPSQPLISDNEESANSASVATNVEVVGAINDKSAPHIADGIQKYVAEGTVSSPFSSTATAPQRKRKRSSSSQSSPLPHRPATRLSQSDRAEKDQDCCESVSINENNESINSLPSSKRQRRPSVKAAAHGAAAVTTAILPKSNQQHSVQNSTRGRREKQLTCSPSSRPSVDVEVLQDSISSGLELEKLSADASLSTGTSHVLAAPAISHPTGVTRKKGRGRPRKVRIVTVPIPAPTVQSSSEEASAQPAVVDLTQPDACLTATVQHGLSLASHETIFLGDTVPDSAKTESIQCCAEVGQRDITHFSETQTVNSKMEVAEHTAVGHVEDQHSGQAQVLADSGAKPAEAAEPSGSGTHTTTPGVASSSSDAPVHDELLPATGSPRSSTSSRSASTCDTGRVAGRLPARPSGSWRGRRSAEILRRSLDLSAAAAVTGTPVTSANADVHGSQLMSNMATPTASRPAVASSSLQSVARALGSSPQRSTAPTASTTQTGQYAYSPCASPSGSILKRRSLVLSAGDANQSSPSPATKPRRVSFANPVEVCAPEDVLCTPQRLSMGVTEATEQKPGPAEPLAEFENVTDKDPSFRDVTPSVLSSSESSLSSPIFYHSTPESQLECRLPICPELISCSQSVDVITPLLTSGAWSVGLSTLLKSRSIFTIGNVASLSEYDIHNLPIRVPKLATVKKALQSILQQKTSAISEKPDTDGSSTTPVTSTDNGTDGSSDAPLDGDRAAGQAPATPAGSALGHSLYRDAPDSAVPMDTEATISAPLTLGISEPAGTIASQDEVTDMVASLLVEPATVAVPGEICPDSYSTEIKAAICQSVTEELEVPLSLTEVTTINQVAQEAISLAEQTSVTTEEEEMDACSGIKLDNATVSSQVAAAQGLTNVEAVNEMAGCSTCTTPVNCNAASAADISQATQAVLPVVGALLMPEAAIQQPLQEILGPSSVLPSHDETCVTSSVANRDNAAAGISSADIVCDYMGSAVMHEDRQKEQVVDGLGAASEAVECLEEQPRSLMSGLLCLQSSRAAEIGRLPTSDLFGAHQLLSEMMAAVMNELKSRCDALS